MKRWLFRKETIAASRLPLRDDDEIVVIVLFDGGFLFIDDLCKRIVAVDSWRSAKDITRGETHFLLKSIDLVDAPSEVRERSRFKILRLIFGNWGQRGYLLIAFK